MNVIFCPFSAGSMYPMATIVLVSSIGLPHLTAGNKFMLLLLSICYVDLTIVQFKNFSSNELLTIAVLSNTHVIHYAIQQSQLNAHIASKHHIV